MAPLPKFSEVSSEFDTVQGSVKVIFGRPNSAGKITGVATGTNQEGLGALAWADGFADRNYETGTPPAAKYRNVSLDLHNGTAIFGASNTVQPASIRFLCLIRSY